MKTRKPAIKALDVLVAGITTGAAGRGEHLRAFHKAIAAAVSCPFAAAVAGSPVEVLKFEYDGSADVGLMAECRGADGTTGTVAAQEIDADPTRDEGLYLGAYRRWMGLKPFPAVRRAQAGVKHPAELPVVDGLVELAILSVKPTMARCRLLRGGGEVSLRAAHGVWLLAPGEIAVVRPAKHWRYGGYDYLSGAVESTRIDPAALGLAPLGLNSAGIWEPAEHYWGEAGEPIEEWAKPVIAGGARPRYEMEQVLPGSDPDDPFSDPILDAHDLRESGDWAGASEMLMRLCAADPRCLDAHAHLGNLWFDDWPRKAIRHYEVGVLIGEWSLGEGFRGVLPWGMIDNRPFLRCMHGYGLCLWRLKRFDEALAVFDRMLWMNPADNQGVRMMIDQVRAGELWEVAERESDG